MEEKISSYEVPQMEIIEVEVESPILYASGEDGKWTEGDM